MQCNVKCDRNWPGAGPGPAKGWKLSECHGNGQLGQGHDSNALIFGIKIWSVLRVVTNSESEASEYWDKKQVEVK